jgi:hypothetical protein
MIQLITAVILAITVVGASAQDGISLNNYFSDGMILQVLFNLNFLSAY